jgi:adenylate cyclase
VASITRRLAAIAFADVAGWAQLVEANELEALRAWSAMRIGQIEPKIAEHAGRLVDLAGDAVLVEFPSAVNAVRWALDLQRLHDHPGAGASGRAIMLRIGIHVSEVLVDEGRLVGDGVNIAARIHQTAAPGEIVVTEAVREHVEQRIPLTLSDLGEHRLKHISRPIRLYRVDAQGPPPAAPHDAGAAEAAPRTLLALELPVPAPPSNEGDEAVAAALRRVDEYVARGLAGIGGRVIRRDSNGLLLDFPDARPAVMAAFAIQRACGNPDAPPGSKRQVLLRMGVQMGEWSNEGSADAPGDAAALHGRGAAATRIASLAGPGEIVASSGVRDELTATLDADIEDLGECVVEAIGPPVRAYRLGPPGALPSAGSELVADELRPTLAVIPFTERGVGHGPLGEILAEEAITALSRCAELNLVSRLSTTAFRGRAATLGVVSGHLRANYVLSGAYRVSSGQLILAAELAEAKSARVVWAGDLKGSVAGIIEGNDELIDRLVAQASSAVMARELERTQSQSLQSLETCTLLIGAIALMHRLSSHDFHRALAMLQAVAQRAPRHPIPQAWLAKWHVLRVWQSWSDDAAADTRLALDCSQRALDNDSLCSLALSVDGFVHTNLLKDFDIAQKRYDLALSVNPSDSLAWLLRGMMHAFKGEGRQAVKDTRRALRLSPLDPHRFFYDSLAGGAELAAGHYERAIELTRRSLQANRMHASTFRMLAISQWQLGRHDEARATVAELMKIEPTLRVTTWLERSPASAYPIGKLCADALRHAGVPQ